jgi:glutamyl-tRNA reductase
MHILSVEISHHNAPVELRERLNFPPDKIKSVFSRANCVDSGAPFADLSEIAVLSTCHRLEVYAVSRRRDFQDLVAFIGESTGVPEKEFVSHAARREQREAVTHFFRVSSGLDSMVLGETQILGQVTDAYEIARACGGAGPILSALFRAAIHAGKRARTETAISRNAGSVSSVAARLAAEQIGDIADAHVVVIGAGEMAELAVEALRHRDAKRITVVNRTHERAAELASRWQAEALGFDRIADALRAADIVVTSTGAPHIVLSRDLVEDVMATRPDRALILIDIAVPRDIDPGVNEVANVSCFDIDDLESRLNDSMSERQKAVPQVEAIIEAEADEFMEYLHALDIVPVVTALRAKAEKIRCVETEKTLRHLAHLSEEDRARVEFLAKSVLDRFLHEPTLRLKASAGSGRAAEYAAAIRYIFDLGEEKPDGV